MSENMKNKDEEFNIVEAVERMQEYWATYDSQYNYEKYGKETFLEDALYGIGHCMYERKWRQASGYRKFKDFLGRRFFKENLEGKR